MANDRILVVEDEKNILKGVTYNLDLNDQVTHELLVYMA